jgi:putative heme-binding domain-containing protein
MVTRVALFTLLLFSLIESSVYAQTVRQAQSLEALLKAAPKSWLIDEIRSRGDAKRGAILFHTSAAACVRCHAITPDQTPVGPRLAELRNQVSRLATDRAYLLTALLEPSRDIRPEYRVNTVLSEDDSIYSGLIVRETEEAIELRASSDLNQLHSIPKSQIESQVESKASLMPDGLIGTLRDQGEFYDLAAYVFAVAEGGLKTEQELMPSSDQIASQEDWLDLDHKGILKKLAKKDFEAGQSIYQGYCIDCHGRDGNTPNLPAARAFGKQPLKFGSDPYRMFLTLTNGNGLMGSMRHLTPYQRYQVIHYIREAFMKPSNPDYTALNATYLDSLPTGSKMGDETPVISRDYGAALGSQLRREHPSALTTSTGSWTVSYDLHSMDIADVWRNAFLELSDTQHQKGRGEGVAEPGAPPIEAMMGWKWGHNGTLDYDREHLPPRGPMPRDWLVYRGYYRHDREIMLSYEVDRRPVLEKLISVKEDSNRTFDANTLRRRMRIAPGRELVLSIAQQPGATTSSFSVEKKTFHREGRVYSIALVRHRSDTTAPGLDKDSHRVTVVVDSDSIRVEIDREGRVVWHIPESDRPLECEILLSPSASVRQEPASSDQAETVARSIALGDWFDRILGRWKDSDFEDWKQGSALWPERLQTVGFLGLEQEGYALDTISIPKSNPWNAWLRTAAIDFYSDGRMLVTTYGGDVWLVSGIDTALKQIEWKRFASGLYEPLGIKIVKDVPYVTCKDRVVRLHDTNGDDEADFYENFFDDPDVSTHFHAFNFDLQIDHEGWLVYAKGGHGADYSIPGAILRISPDGTKKEVYATGFRVPNGMGILPDGRLTCSDNQGQWMPASKINLLRRGGYYGWVPTYGQSGKWSADGGKIDLSKVVPPDDFDRPLVWIPHELDNSSGGQLWAGDARWGPLSGHLLHTSFGKGWMYYVLTQEVGELTQGAIIKLPFDFQTGIMRARLHPQDGQVYAVGLQGWNGSGRIGLRDEGIQRLRYTGRDWKMVSDAKVERGEIVLRFNFPISADSVQREGAVTAKAWNYRWSSAYGSDRYSPTTKKLGVDSLAIPKIALDKDGTVLRIETPGLCPVDQLHLTLQLKAQDGTVFEEELYWTIHAIPEDLPED